ncbi:protein kinase C beta type-like [Rana temporaria]|uniref:protein kinase C beta type-like n=1 Tax=Rana temporaria TaxID=8407 RepID=UPI001AAD918D|nr:protein kinase C beta type-like [Rana temporaria]
MIYEMATGRHPYCTSKMTKPQVKKAIMEPVSEYPRDMDPDLRGLIMRHLEMNQAWRRELVHDVRDHAFFRGVNWKDLELGKVKPLDYTRPRLETQDENFKWEDVIPSEPSSRIPSKKQQKIFSGFYFES